MTGNTILIIAPHTDDGELGCGGTIARLVGEGKEVFYAAFSIAEDSVPEGLRKDILRDELHEAVSVLGINPQNLIVYDYKVRKFTGFRQSILEDMVELNKLVIPKTVFVPSRNDRHQDHGVISSEGFRAFKRCTVLGYELPWNNDGFPAQAFFELEEEYLTKKVCALKCYESQAGRPYMDESFITGLALTRGIQAGCRFAEAFEVMRLIL